MSPAPNPFIQKIPDMNYTAPRSGSIRKAHSPGGLPVRAEEATRGSHRRPVFRQPAGARTCSESRLSAQIIPHSLHKGTDGQAHVLRQFCGRHSLGAPFGLHKPGRATMQGHPQHAGI